MEKNAKESLINDLESSTSETHEQVSVELRPGYHISVDKGLEDIVEALFRWDLQTIDLCIDNHGDVWIQFATYQDCRKFMVMAIRHSSTFEFIKDSLWWFLDKHADFNIVFYEEEIRNPEEDGGWIGTGQLDDSVGLRFKKDLLEEFRRLIHITLL